MEHPEWLGQRGIIDESLFCLIFLNECPMMYCGGQFVTPQGSLEEAHVQRLIFDRIAPWVRTALAQKSESLLRALKIKAYSPVSDPGDNKVVLQNGSYYLFSGFYPDTRLLLENRLPVLYDPKAPRPEKWLAFLEDLLEPEDILTLQEYLGYCLVPSTRAQKMLMIIGRGGEGKSHVGYAMAPIFGSMMNTTSIRKVEQDRFARADLEGKLLMVDDDMDMNALKKTNYVKSIITAQGRMDLERKGRQSTQGKLYVRFLCFGNGALTALHDRSDGFFRRQIILTTRERPADRRDNRFLREELEEEREGILLWMLEGLERLINQNYQFTISDRSRENMRQQISSSNNVKDFLESEGYIRFVPGAKTSTRDLHAVYQDWCGINAEVALGVRSFTNYLTQNQKQYGLTPTNGIYIGGRQARGYEGVEVVP